MVGRRDWRDAKTRVQRANDNAWIQQLPWAMIALGKALGSFAQHLLEAHFSLHLVRREKKGSLWIVKEQTLCPSTEFSLSLPPPSPNKTPSLVCIYGM